MRRRMMRVLGAVAAMACMSAGSAFAQERSTTTAKQPEIAGFHVVLLMASNKPGPAPEGLTPAMVKAMKDVEPYLPFKSYRWVDSTLLRGGSGGTTRIGGQWLMELAASGRANAEDRFSVNFTVRDAYRNPSTASVLATSFRIGVGETVVAGTSRVTDEALVMLVTALSQSSLK